MATITLKNIPADLHRELKKRAEEHHRSLNQGNNRDFKECDRRNHRVDVEARSVKPVRSRQIHAPDQRR